MALPVNRALVVEDDRSWQQLLGEILSDAGLVVDWVEGLEAALAAVRSAPHQLAVVDLALSEHDHTNQDGLRVLDALKRHDPGCPAILLTGFATVELAVSALTEHGAYTCLRKETFRRAEFRQQVRRALEKTAVGFKTSPAAPGTGRGEAFAPGVSSEADLFFCGAALVVEDDAGWRSLFLELLADTGFRVRLCSSVGEGLSHLRREKYALAVIDLSLTGPVNFATVSWEESSSKGELEGYRLLASTRAGGIPTIVVSGVGSPADIERAFSEQGIFAYLPKQVFNRQLFLQTVKDALAAGHTNRELEQLTERERQVLDLLAQGMTNKEIAETLVISTNTVKRHLKAIFEKLDIHTRSAAAAKAVGGG
jgi:DNA-binding NarL/FixJ family response regulator